MHLLRDPLWQFVGATVAAFALIVSVIVSLIQRQKKKLEYEVITDRPLLTFGEEVRGRLRVLVDERPVDDPALVVVLISNRGNVPIRAADFERPLILRFGGNAQLLSADITDQQPPNLHATVTVDANIAVLQPILLNPADIVEIKCLVSGEHAVTAEARIV